jgi:hypothetical protein
MVLLEPGGDGTELAFDLGDAHTRFETAHHVEEMAQDTGLVGCHAHRHPDLRIVGKLVTARHDADDGVDLVIESDRGAQHLVAATKVALPQVVAYDHHSRRGTGAVLFGQDAAAQSRFDPQQRH